MYICIHICTCIHIYMYFYFFDKGMIDVPHVKLMTCSNAFLGIFDRVREMSVLFEGPLGT
jgi:hypothetical protein